MNRLTVLIMFLLGALTVNAATIETVLSGSPYDGLIRTANGSYLVATADSGGITQFNGTDNESIYQGGSYMLGVVEDSNGDIFATDWISNRVIKIDANGQQQIITEAVSSPGNIVESPDGSFYVGSVLSGGLYKVTKSGQVTTILTPEQISGPLASTFDADGNFYVSSTATAEIFKISGDDFELFATLPVNFGSYRIAHMAYIDGFIYATSFSANLIYRVTTSGEVEVAAGAGAEGDAGSFTFRGPTGIAAGSKPYEIYVASYSGRDVQKIQLDAPAGVPIEPHHTGLWYNSEQSGHGLSLDVLDNNRMVVYWYVYDNEGQPLWLLGAGSYADGVAILDVTINENGLFPPNFVADDVSSSQWGTFTLQFNDCNTLQFDWAPVEGLDFSAGSLDMVRLAANAGLPCNDQ